MDTNNPNFDKESQNIPSAKDSMIFGTSSNDIIQGLQAEAYTDSAVSGLPDDDDQIVNEQDQQDITNQPDEEIQTNFPQPETATPGNIPGLEKDLLDKTILEEGESTGEEDTNDVKTT